MSENKVHSPIPPNKDTKVVLWLMLKMFGCLGGALVLAVVHHCFLAYLNGRDVVNFSQFWIKNAGNLLSLLLGILLGVTAAAALAQIVSDVPATERFLKIIPQYRFGNAWPDAQDQLRNWITFLVSQTHLKWCLSCDSQLFPQCFHLFCYLQL